MLVNQGNNLTIGKRAKVFKTLEQLVVRKIVISRKKSKHRIGEFK